MGLGRGLGSENGGHNHTAITIWAQYIHQYIDRCMYMYLLGCHLHLTLVAAFLNIIYKTEETKKPLMMRLLPWQITSQNLTNI